MFAVKALYEEKEFKPQEAIPVDGDYEVIITFVGPIEKTSGAETVPAKMSRLRRLTLLGIVLSVLAGIGALVFVSSRPGMVPLINASIHDEMTMNRILIRLEQEGVQAIVSPARVIQVKDEATARRIRGILIRDDLIPYAMDSRAIFGQEHWVTDFERNVNTRRAISRIVTDHITAMDDVDDAFVTIVWPARSLFPIDQNPATASVIIIPRVGSDITQNRAKIEGIVKLLQYAIDDLRAENIVITDHTGYILNDFY